MNCYCSFCASAGVAGPHDHFLRATKALGAATTCPKLKTTECGHCGRKGHTARYCGEWGAEKKIVQAAALVTKKTKFNAGEWQEIKSVPTREHPGFESPRLSRKRVVTPAAPKLACRFAALDIESGEENNEPIVPLRLPQTWAQVAQCAAKDSDDLMPPLNWGKANGARWADAEDSDDELPPLNWGARWADVAG
jgi:hypothetical protein